MSTAQEDSNDPEINKKIGELFLERDEHKLVMDTLSKLEESRKAFRLVNGILVERTVGEVYPIVAQNYEGIKKIISTLEESLVQKEGVRAAYKEKHGIMTQQEREAKLKQMKKLDGGEE